MNTLYRHFLKRVNLTVWILVVIVAIIILQSSLTEEIKVGALVPHSLGGYLALTLTNRVWLGIKVLALAPIVVFWLMDRPKELRYVLLFSLALLTFELLTSVLFLVLTLASDTARTAIGLTRDTITVALINILVFSLWYWIIDAYPLQTHTPEELPNDFLFPQFGQPSPKFAKWQPAYLDYLFLAFTTTTAFGPTDTLPLTHRAKMLMMLQALLSLIVIVVLAGRALSIMH